MVDEGEGEFSVRWNQPKTTKPVSKFIVQYRLPNETFWRSLSEPEVNGFFQNLIRAELGLITASGNGTVSSDEESCSQCRFFAFREKCWFKWCT